MHSKVTGGEQCDFLCRFLRVPAARTKAQTPNMGWFIPLLTLGTRPDHTWKRMASVIVEEGLDRSIIWICKHNPSLQESLMKDPDSGGADDDLLQQSFAACCVGLKLTAFHVAFLALIARPQGSTLQQVHATPLNQLAVSPLFQISVI